MPVCYRGIRSPNPEKDSVLLLGTDGRWRSHDLVDRVREGPGCTEVSGGWGETWGLFPAPEPSVLARVFERGSYHLADGALRYRRGRGGRQPLTPERIDLGGLVESGEHTVRLAWEVVLTGSREAPHVLSWRGVAW